MQPSQYIPRKLTVDDQVIPEAEALLDGSHVVVLAEPGAGKTELLKNFARILGVGSQRASIFRSRPHGQYAETLIIDGFDELAKLNQSSFDDLIGKIADAGPERLIIASRSSEWESARYNRLIQDFLGSEPLVVRLKAFDESEQKQLFETLHPKKCFKTFKDAATEFGIHVLLGNPQMLRIIALAHDNNGGIFRSRSQIFSDAFAAMCREHNPDIPVRDRLSSKDIEPVDCH